MNKLALIFAALLGTIVVSGCGSSDATATKQEENSFRNPPKEMPKEAQEAMAKMGAGGPPAGASTAGSTGK